MSFRDSFSCLLVFFISAVPSKPLMVKTVDHEDDPDDKVIVSWQPPNNTAGVDVSQLVYRVKYCKNDNEVCKSIDTVPGITKLTIGDLTEDKDYVITIQALGLSGEPGEVSDAVTHKTDGKEVFTFLRLYCAFKIAGNIMAGKSSAHYTVINLSRRRSI